MVTSFALPPVGFGPGSRPPDGDDELTFMSMPGDMRTFSPSVPEVKNPSLLVPALDLLAAFAACHPATLALAQRRPGVVNAPSLLAELLDKSLTYRPGQEIHLIDLSLLPHTDEDLLWIDAEPTRRSVIPGGMARADRREA
jgi:hypothetical protein